MNKNSTRLDALKIELIEWLIKIEDKETMEYLKIVKDSKSQTMIGGMIYLHRNNPVLRDV